MFVSLGGQVVFFIVRELKGIIKQKEKENKSAFHTWIYFFFRHSFHSNFWFLHFTLIFRFSSSIFPPLNFHFPLFIFFLLFQLPFSILLFFLLAIFCCCCCCYLSFTFPFLYFFLPSFSIFHNFIFFILFILSSISPCVSIDPVFFLRLRV